MIIFTSWAKFIHIQIFIPLEIAKQVVMVVKNEMRFFYQKRNVLQI